MRELGYALLKEKGYDEKFQGVECLVKVAKSYTSENLRQLERILG